MKELEEIRTRLEAEEAFENSAEIGLNLVAALEAALSIQPYPKGMLSLSESCTASGWDMARLDIRRAITEALA